MCIMRSTGIGVVCHWILTEVEVKFKIYGRVTGNSLGLMESGSPREFGHQRRTLPLLAKKPIPGIGEFYRGLLMP